MDSNKELADRFNLLAYSIESVIEPNTNVNMNQAWVYASNNDTPSQCGLPQLPAESDGVCGTVGCAAGWCAVALRENTGYEIRNFEYGVNAADEFLFDDLYDGGLAMWAHNNPDLWGNDYGYHVWHGNCGGMAWGQLTRAFPPSVLVDHLRAVAGRIRAAKYDVEVGWSL